MGNLIRRLTVLEHRGGGSARADGLDALAAWVRGARGRLNQDVTDDDVWAFVLGLDDLQLANMRLASRADGTLAHDLAAGGYLGDEARQALAGDDDLLSLLVGGLQPAELTEREFQALDAALMGMLYGRTEETDGAVGSLPGALAGEAEHEG